MHEPPEPGRSLRGRWLIATLAGVAVLAIAAIPLLHRPAPPARAGEPSLATAGPSSLPVVHESGGDGIQRGPVQATIGVPYPFDLFVHCGIRYANFGRSWWLAEQVQLDYHPRSSHYRDRNYVPGTMTLVNLDEARFEAPDEGLYLTFHPLVEEPEGCD